MHPRDEGVVEIAEEAAQRGVARRLLGRHEFRALLGEQRGDVRIAILRARHGLHHVAGIDRVVVAVERDIAPVARIGRERRGLGLLRAAVAGTRREARVRGRRGWLEARKELAVQIEGARVLGFVDRVGRGAGSDEQAA